MKTQPTPTSTGPVDEYIAAMQRVGRKTSRTTRQAAQTFENKIADADGWKNLMHEQQSDAIDKARSYASWLIVTTQLTIDPELFELIFLKLGKAGRAFCPDAYAWFVAACAPLNVDDLDINFQWNSLLKMTAITGVAPDKITKAEFVPARRVFLKLYVEGKPYRVASNYSAVFHRLQLTMHQAGRLDTYNRVRNDKVSVTITGWDHVPAGYRTTTQRYLQQVKLSLRPNTITHYELYLREFGTWLASNYPNINGCADLQRQHIEAYKIWLSERNSHFSEHPIKRTSVKARLACLNSFFLRITEWDYDDVPKRALLFNKDLPIVDKPLPRFLDDAAATKLMRTSRANPDPLSRLIVELFARTGIRKTELIQLELNSVVQIGSAFWLRVPIGKLHNDRYVPLHPQLKEMIDDYLANHRPDIRSTRLLVDGRHPLNPNRVVTALSRISHEAGIGHVTPHQLRHTLATQAINRGMSLDAIASLLGHKTLGMTMIYARIADKTVADQYFSVTDKVEALYNQPKDDPTTETSEMRKLRNEMHRRMLGNGYCARPVEMDCHFESICESCTFFVTTIEFKPTLRKQREDAATKGQTGRVNIFDSLLERLDNEQTATTA